MSRHIPPLSSWDCNPVENASYRRRNVSGLLRPTLVPPYSQGKRVVLLAIQWWRYASYLLPGRHIRSHHKRCNSVLSVDVGIWIPTTDTVTNPSNETPFQRTQQQRTGSRAEAPSYRGCIALLLATGMHTRFSDRPKTTWIPDICIQRFVTLRDA